MSKQKLTCPVCGSSKIKRHEIQSDAELALGDRFSFQEVYYKCNNCEEEIDIENETDKNYLRAKKQAEMVLVQTIIANLSYLGISMAYFERAFGLPIRTLTRWKTGDFSATALALLRITITYPWIVSVAEKKFSNEISHQFILENIQTSQINFISNSVAAATAPGYAIGA